MTITLVVSFTERFSTLDTLFAQMNSLTNKIRETYLHTKVVLHL